MAKVVIYSRVGEATASLRNALTAAGIPFVERRADAVRIDELRAQMSREYNVNDMKQLLQEIAVTVRELEDALL